MKKTMKSKIVSLALSAMAVCSLGALLPFMGKTNAAASTAYYTLDGFTISEKASVRTKDYNGIRFTTKLSAETKATVAASLSNPEYGTLLLPADMLGAEELTHETESVVVVPSKIWQDDDTYTAVLAGKKNSDGTYSNLPDSYYNRPIAARSYVSGKDSKGNTVVYYSENTATRSIGYVATLAKLDGNSSTMVGDIAADSKVELVFDANEQVSVLQSQAVGTAIIENKYDATTDRAAVVTVGGIPLTEEYITQHGIVISYSTSAADVISVSGETLTAKKAGEATITATVNFNGKTLTATKTLSTEAYLAKSAYKILISEEAEKCALNEETNYLPAQSADAYNAYYNAFEKTAAYKLQKILEEATGVRLEVVTKVEPGSKYISIGETSLGSSKNLSADVLAKDTASAVTVDSNGNVIICGTKQQGTLYGVQQFLGEFVGYEYFMEYTYTVDSNVEVILDADKEYIPDVEYNVLQGDLERVNLMDEYTMQFYTEQIIPTGTSDKEDSNGYYYKGIAHNSVVVLQEGTYQVEASKTRYEGFMGLGATDYYSYDTVSGESWQKWYATTTEYVGTSKKTVYHIMNNPYYEGTDNPDTATDESQEKIFAELCYTAHGDAEQRNRMIASVVDQMYAKMQKFPTLERIGFAHMDHRVWCECSSCKGQGNPSDNMLIFLLDVAAGLKTKLVEVGDARANTFKICSLFYHATNASPTKTTDYTDKLSGYMKHVEPWFAESGADHVDPYYLTEAQKTEIKNNNSNNNWNANVYTYLTNWKNICNTYGADLFLWVYYSNTTSYFIPYNTFNAIRVNYGTFADFGVDYVFNQMMESKQDWARFKEFLISKLAWNAHPTDTEWEAWYTEYFEGSYGPGAAGMREYFNLWDTWTTNNVNEFRRNNSYNYTSSTDASMTKDIRTSSYKTKLTASELESWIISINKAIAALDVSDPNYDTYRRNIMLEKLTPMYLLMYMHDGYNSSRGTFSGTTYVSKYGEEFLTWVKEWNITRDGEGDSRLIQPFLDAIASKGYASGEVASNKVIADKQYINIGAAVSLNNLALADGTYTVSGAISGTVTANGGAVTLNSNALTAGQTYELLFTNNATGATVRYTNIIALKTISASAGAVSGNNGYYYVANNYYIEEGKVQLVINHDLFKKGDYALTIAGETSNVSVFIEGKLTVELGKKGNGQSTEVICVDKNNNTYIFNVVCAKFIRTVEELQALGVGGGIKGDHSSYVDDGVLYGNGNSWHEGNDVEGYYVLANDLDCSGYYLSAGYSGQKSWFKGTFDGNGHTIYNVIVSEGGIFGGMKNATIRNVNFANVAYHGNGSGLPNGGRGYNNNTQWGQYFGLLGQVANGITVENINVQVSEYKTANAYPFGLLVFRASDKTTNTFRNINVNASGLMLDNVLTTHADEGTVIYENVTIKAAGYNTIARVKEQVADGVINEWPTGVTYVSSSNIFNITNTQKNVGVGESLVITTNQPSYSYSYALKEAVRGVSISGNTVSVSADAKLGATFTVVVTEACGCEREITFTVTKAIITLSEVLNIEQVSGSFVLPAEIEGEILSVTIGSETWTNVTGKTITLGAKDLVKQENLGKGKTILVETATAIYEIPANVYTMVIDSVAELDQWQAVAAENAVKAGLCIEAQKGMTYNGYFVLGTDIEYNKTWAPYKAYGSLWGLCYNNANIWTGGVKDSGTLVEGAFQEDWGSGKLGGFKGVFDGDGYYIRGLETSGKYSAFIVTSGGGTVKDVAFLDAKVGAEAGYVFNRGPITVENVYIELASVANGTSGAETVLFGINGGGNGRSLKNILIDASNVDLSTWTNGYIGYIGSMKATGVYVLDADGIELGSSDLSSGKAVAFYHYNGNVNSADDYDTAGLFANAEALLADATHGAIVKAWDTSFWTVDAENNLVLPKRIYKAITSQKNLTEKVTVEVVNGSFIVPNEVEGALTKVILNGVELTNVSGNTATISAADFATLDMLGEDKEIVIYTESYTYHGKANIYTDIITTADELRALGVGGQEDVFTDSNGNERVYGNGNSGTEGNDKVGYYVLGGDIDCADAEVFAAGHNYQKSFFKGIFDGKGHTIKNITVNEGGIFGGLSGATIRNVNFTGVVYDATLNNFAGNWSNYTALLAHLAKDGTVVENIDIQVAQTKFRFGSANLKEGLLFSTGWGGVIVRDVTIDASYLKLECVLGENIVAGAYTFKNVLIKAASYAHVGTGAAVNDVRPELQEWPDGVIFEKVAEEEEEVIANRPIDTAGNEIALYKGDVTALGFAAGTNVFAATTADMWNDRIIIPANANYDYVEFDIVFTVTVGHFTMWPALDSTTKGSMTIGTAGATPSADGMPRTVEIYDANGNIFKAGAQAQFEANNVYTIRVGYSDLESVKLNQMHVGTSTAQTYYVTASRFGNYSNTRVYTAESGALLPYYTGDVTAVGYAAGAKVTAATITNGWDNRVRIPADQNYDYVDVQFSTNRANSSGTIWMNNIAGAMMHGSYSVSLSGATPSDANVAAKVVQFFNANGTIATSLVANTVYTMRVYLDGAGSIEFGTFNCSADNPITFYFGAITLGNVIDLDETVEIEVANGKFALPTTIAGTIKSVSLDGKEIFSSVSGGKVVINASAVDSYGAERSLSIITDVATYSLEAMVVTKYIKTAEDLKALGVGGNRTNTENIYGYYALANDITFEHASDYSDLMAAGYPKNGDYSFYGTFDGCGYTLYNMRVCDGGIFGIMRGTVKNLNLVDVYLTDSPASGVSNQNGAYIAILAHAAPSGVFENINISIASSPSAWSWKRDGLLVNSGSWGSTTFRNITIDATGLKLKTLLGISHNSANVYENVVIKAMDYVAIGYTADSYATVDGKGVQNTAALMNEFPAGVTFIPKGASKTIVWANGNTELPVYSGDVTALGFAAGTKVYEAVQDNRTGMWGGGQGTNLGLTMEQQRIRITKAPSEDYASVQFSVSRAFTGKYAFYTWYMAEAKAGGSRPSSSVYFMADGSSGNNLGISAVAYDMNGKKATTFVPGQVYELRWYDANHIAYGFEFGCCEANGESITVYFANQSAGNENPVTVGKSETSLLGRYMGDVTALGFAAGTDVYYEVQDNRTNAWSAGTAYALTMEQQTVVISKGADEEYASIQFMFSRDLAATGSIFTAWYFDEAGANKGLCGYLKANGTYSKDSALAIADFKVEAYDMDGNKVTSFKANTVYEMRWYGTGITSFKIGCMEANGEHLTIYWANPSSSNNA